MGFLSTNYLYIIDTKYTIRMFLSTNYGFIIYTYRSQDDKIYMYS